MIYTVTFNPALDYIIRLDNFSEGAVNKSADGKILPGGKGINVSTVLKNLGVDSLALGFTAGFTGDILESLLSDMGIKSDFIRLTDGFSRINVKLKSHTETEINGRGPEIDSRAMTKLYEKLSALKDGDILVLAGSALSDMAYKEITDRLKDKKLQIVVDASGDLLLNALPCRPFLIKPNIFELGEIFGRELETDEEIIDCAKELQARGALNVLVSLGGSGAILLTQSGQILKQAAPCGKVINTTGAGDSMVAGFIFGYLETGDLKYALKMGVCAGSAAAFSENLAAKDEIMKIYNDSKASPV